MLCKMQELFPENSKCVLYHCLTNPFSSSHVKSDDVLVENAEIVSYLGNRCFIGERSFDLGVYEVDPQGVYMYVSDDVDIVLKLPRGYKGAFTYYKIAIQK